MQLGKFLIILSGVWLNGQTSYHGIYFSICGVESMRSQQWHWIADDKDFEIVLTFNSLYEIH